MTIAARKAAARRAAFDARKVAFVPDRIAAVAKALTEALEPYRAQPISGYLPIRTEADPRPAMTAHLAHGTVGVPVVAGPDRPLIFRPWTPDAPLEPSGFGVMVPSGVGEMVPEILIVPLLSFDGRGFRLGYGGGYYDRTLEALRREGEVLAIGFAFAAQEVASVPVEPVDQPLDAIVTEDGLRRF